MGSNIGNGYTPQVVEMQQPGFRVNGFKSKLDFNALNYVRSFIDYYRADYHNDRTWKRFDDAKLIKENEATAFKAIINQGLGIGALSYFLNSRVLTAELADLYLEYLISNVNSTPSEVDNLMFLGAFNGLRCQDWSQLNNLNKLIATIKGCQDAVEEPDGIVIFNLTDEILRDIPELVELIFEQRFYFRPILNGEEECLKFKERLRTYFKEDYSSITFPQRGDNFFSILMLLGILSYQEIIQYFEEYFDPSEIEMIKKNNLEECFRVYILHNYVSTDLWLYYINSIEKFVEGAEHEFISMEMLKYCPLEILPYYLVRLTKRSDIPCNKIIYDNLKHLMTSKKKHLRDFIKSYDPKA